MYLVVRRRKRTVNKKTGLEYIDIVSNVNIKDDEDLWVFNYLDKEEEQFKYHAIKGVLLYILFPLKIKNVKSKKYLTTFIEE
jgi:hypothetical protein